MEQARNGHKAQRSNQLCQGVNDIKDRKSRHCKQESDSIRFTFLEVTLLVLWEQTDRE